MRQEMNIIGLLQTRCRLYTDLKNLLEKQQRVLLENDSQTLQTLSENLLQKLEEIQTSEENWLAAINELKIEAQARGLIFSSQRELLEFFVPDHLGEQFHRLWQELENTYQKVHELRQSNRLLIENSLLFINKMFTALKEEVVDHSLYHPGKKQVVKNLMINQKI